MGDIKQRIYFAQAIQGSFMGEEDNNVLILYKTDPIKQCSVSESFQSSES